MIMMITLCVCIRVRVRVRVRVCVCVCVSLGNFVHYLLFFGVETASAMYVKINTKKNQEQKKGEKERIKEYEQEEQGKEGKGGRGRGGRGGKKECLDNKYIKKKTYFPKQQQKKNIYIYKCKKSILSHTSFQTHSRQQQLKKIKLKYNYTSGVISF